MSPLEISIALHYWVSPTPWKGGSENWADIDAKIVHSMVLAKLLEYQGANLSGNTPAMRAYVEALSEVQWPEIRWVVPTGPRVVAHQPDGAP